jgi:hypothetical protein
VQRNLLADQHAGIVGRGGVQLHPHVAGIHGDQATVLDCVFSSSMLVYAQSGQPVPPVTPAEHDGVRSTLVQSAPGVWKLSTQTVTEGRCPPGY